MRSQKPQVFSAFFQERERRGASAGLKPHWGQVLSNLRAKLATLDRAVDGLALTAGYLLPAIVYTVLR